MADDASRPAEEHGGEQRDDGEPPIPGTLLLTTLLLVMIFGFWVLMYWTLLHR